MNLARKGDNQSPRAGGGSHHHTHRGGGGGVTRPNVRQTLLLLAVLVAGYGWGRTCLHCAGKREGLPALDRAEHGWPGLHEKLEVPDQFFAQLENQVRQNPDPGGGLGGGLDGLKGVNQTEALRRALLLQQEQLRQQRLMLLETWQQVRAVRRRHEPATSLRGIRDHQSLHSSGRTHREDHNSPRSGKACREQRPARQGAASRKLQWDPPEERYLLATCVFGRISNRLKCLRNYVLAATLLQRRLIIPTQDLQPSTQRWNSAPEASYRFDLAFNISHLNDCFGRSVAIPTKGYALETGSSSASVRVDKLLCWAPRCGFVRGKTSLWPKDPKLVLPHPTISGLNRTVNTAAFLAVYGGVKARVLCLGDLFDTHAMFADPPPGFELGLADGWHVPGMSTLVQLPGPLRPAGGFSPCRSLIWPHSAILSSATGFVHEVLGSRFAALHLRRDDLYRQCVVQMKCEYWSQRQVAECVLIKMRDADLEVLFLASDTSNEDLALFLSMLQEPRDYGPPIKIIRLGKMEGKMWAEAVNRASVAQQPMVVATVEKFVCALSVLFMSTPGSTFSEHIESMRQVLRTSSCADGPFCQGHSLPERIAAGT